MKLLLSLLTLITLSSCSTVNTPVQGMIFNDTKGPTMITDGRLSELKKGEACIESIIGIATGDASIQTAAKQARIKNVTHVDHRTKNILGFYVEYCTIVYGR